MGNNSYSFDDVVLRQASSNLSNVEKLEIAHNDRLSNALTGLIRGRKPTRRSWEYENIRNPFDVISRWQAISKHVLRNYPIKDRLLERESTVSKRFVPQGGVPTVFSAKSETVLKPLFDSSPYNNELALQNYFQYSLPFAKYLFGSGKINTQEPYPLKFVVNRLDESDKLVTNSGYPHYTKRQNVINESLSEAETGRWKQFPAILIFRFYRGKLRPVWGYPMATNLIETAYSAVIQDVIRYSTNPLVRQWVSPWEGFNRTKTVMLQQFTSNKYLYGGDTDTMDARMRPAQIRLVFEICKHLFKVEYRDSLYEAMTQVNRINLLVSANTKLTGDHGLASGSSWTQLSETILIMFMAWFNHENIGQGIGDDFFFASNRRYTDNDLVDMLSQFGLPAKVEKQSVSENEVTFLQRYMHRGFTARETSNEIAGYYSTDWALWNMMFPEKTIKPKDYNSDIFCARIYSILENTVDCPQFPQFVQFVVKGQKDLIPFARLSRQQFRVVDEKVRLIPGFWPSYNREKEGKSLSEYASIRIARSL